MSYTYSMNRPDDPPPPRNRELSFDDGTWGGMELHELIRILRERVLAAEDRISQLENAQEDTHG